jgi:hypothetical protein
LGRTRKEKPESSGHSNNCPLIPHRPPKPCILTESNKATYMDDLWSEIQDMPGEIFDITELEENDSKMNIQLDEFSNTDYTV